MNYVTVLHTIKYKYILANIFLIKEDSIQIKHIKVAIFTNYMDKYTQTHSFFPNKRLLVNITTYMINKTPILNIKGIYQLS